MKFPEGVKADWDYTNPKAIPPRIAADSFWRGFLQEVIRRQPRESENMRAARWRFYGSMPKRFDVQTAVEWCQAHKGYTQAWARPMLAALVEEKKLVIIREKTGKPGPRRKYYEKA